MTETTRFHIPLTKRIKFIELFPCFATFTMDQKKELAELFHEFLFHAQDVIVTENEIIDSVYIIMQGEAEVTRESTYKKKKVAIPVAILGEGEAIGLNDTGFYSSNGKRTATVTAITAMVLLKLDLKDLHLFLKKYNLESVMLDTSSQMLKMKFIKQSLPFSKISHERLQWLAERVNEITLPAGTIIFEQNTEGSKCYLISAGAVEILSKNEKGEERQLAILKPPILFGEATLITREPRNATAKAIAETTLLTLDREDLSELIESEKNVANMFMTLMIDRSRPLQNKQVISHQRLTADQQEITILKNLDNGKYFKLSSEGEFIWRQLDGHHTLQDITMSLAHTYNVFAPDMVVALISKLTRAGFISNLEIQQLQTTYIGPLWARLFTKVRRVLEFRYAFGEADQWIAKTYNRYVRYLFSTIGQIILAIIVISGLVVFFLQTENILTVFRVKHASFLLLLALIPLSLAESILHELGHAFAVKAFGHEVRYIGIGWLWFAPIAFTDTSDMWLANRRPRMIVNFAGVYVDFLIASMATLSLLFITNPYAQCLLWLFALYTYVGGIRMLSPLQEMDGYYVLMDWVERPRLQQSAVLWLLKEFPSCLRHPKLFASYWPEVAFWLSSIVYLTIITVLTFAIQSFVFDALGIKSNHYLSLIIPFMVLIVSSIGIIAEIKNKAEEI